MNSVIRVDGLGKSFRATRALDGVDLVVRRGTVRAECAAPATAAEAAALDALAARVFSAPEAGDAEVPTHDLDEFYLVASWFRRHPEELGRVERPGG